MCGIAGILKLNHHHRIEEGRLLRMRDSLWHRGPDDAGVMVAERIGLAHRRLSIIDLAGGHQPMPNATRDVWITYNGEVYNYRELRSLLQSWGFRFETESDTEVILHAWELFGETCVEHLRGMFAFAIWDVRKQRLFLARDRLGIKPLYYAVTEKELLFGSEIKAILAAQGVRPRLNQAILPEFLATRFVAGAETFFQGIHKLLPGHTMSWTPDSGITEFRYWKPPTTHQGEERLSRNDYIETIRCRLSDAVRSHLVSDVPVGLFLSGGLDSSLLAALMAPMVDEPIQTFSVGFSESDANELAYARMAAESVGSDHRDVLVSPAQFFSALPSMIWHEDEPIAFTSSIPLHIISRLAHEHVKVVLTGEGADELFLGYGYRYRATAWNSRFGAVYGKVFPGGAREAIAAVVPKLPKAMRRYAERTFLALDMEPRQLFFENFAVFKDELRESLLENPELFHSREPYAQGLRCYHDAGTETLQCMSHADLQTYLVELLMKQDQMSMAASLESRVPFLDHLLVEHVAAIPGSCKLRGWQTKALLREAVSDLVPKEILTRKKMGFPVPTSSWLRSQFRHILDEFVLGPRSLERGYFRSDTLTRLVSEHCQGKADHGERLWLLVNLEMWQRIFIDGEDPALVYGNTDHPEFHFGESGFRAAAAH
ncbi:MAG: asparagine synthase (glutamine-hydrolyzing) [Pseudohongiellaceae bacterium]